MKSSVETINSVQRRVKVELPADIVNKAFETAWRRLQKKARVQGFRPGKAPLTLIKKLYGASVAGEVGENLVNGHLFPILQEQNVRPVASPVLETTLTPVPDTQFEFSAVVDVMPEIDLGNYKGLAVSVEKFEVQAEAVDRELDFLRRRQAKTRALDAGTPAAAGHLVTISQTATMNGKDVPGMKVQSFDVALGRGELFEELEKALTGMKSGENKKVAITMPENYGDKDLAGQTLDFDLNVQNVQELVMPTVDDEFAKDINFESAEKLRSDIHNHLQQRADGLRRQRLETLLLDKILDTKPFEVPPSMVDQVIDSMIQEMQWPSEDQRKQALHDQELRKSCLQSARRKAQNTLILWRVAQAEKLEVTEDDIRKHLTDRMGAGSDAKQLESLVRSLGPRIKENLIFDKAMEFLITSAVVTDIPAKI